jgi:hypothetical protein
MPLYDEMTEIGHEQTTRYREFERLADENGYFGLLWVDAVSGAMKPQESRPLKTPEAKTSALNEALTKPDLFRLYELMRPKEGRGAFSVKDLQRIGRLEKTTRNDLDRLHRPLKVRLENREANAASAKRRRRIPRVLGRVKSVPPILALLGDLGGTIGLFALIYGALRWVGIF